MDVIKDAICRLIFLNLVLDEEKILSYKLKLPFDELLKTRVVNSGRGGATRTLDLTLPKRAL